MLSWLDYGENVSSSKNLTSANIEDQENEFKGLDLLSEESERGYHFSGSGFSRLGQQDKTGSDWPGSSPVLGATLSQRKELLKQRIEELLAILLVRSGS